MNGLLLSKMVASQWPIQGSEIAKALAIYVYISRSLYLYKNACISVKNVYILKFTFFKTVSYF